MTDTASPSCSVDPGSAAEKAGLQNGDVITKVDDTVIDSPDTLGAAIAASPARPITSP